MLKAIEGRSVQGFLNAASPGLITAFQPNAIYPSHDAYLADLVAAMRPEYEAIAASGLQLQLDCPDLAMSRHTAFQDLSEAAVPEYRRRQYRGAQCRDRRHRAAADAHARLLGQL